MIISEITPINIFSSGQLLSISVYMGLSSFISPLLGGVLAQQLSLNQALYFLVCCQSSLLFVITVTGSIKEINEKSEQMCTKKWGMPYFFCISNKGEEYLWIKKCKSQLK
ncbi:hypothetical protein SNF32_15790 [Enterococcus mundtii]|nr:hypothetical protein [Enterococcus mundtii]